MTNENEFSEQLPEWGGELRHQQEKLYIIARNACEGLRLFTWLSMDDETRDAFLDLARQLEHVQGLYRRVREERAG